MCEVSKSLDVFYIQIRKLNFCISLLPLNAASYQSKHEQQMPGETQRTVNNYIIHIHASCLLTRKCIFLIKTHMVGCFWQEKKIICHWRRWDIRLSQKGMLPLYWLKLLFVHEKQNKIYLSMYWQNQKILPHQKVCFILTHKNKLLFK